MGERDLARPRRGFRDLSELPYQADRSQQHDRLRPAGRRAHGGDVGRHTGLEQLGRPRRPADQSDFTQSGVAFIAAAGDHGYESSPDYPAALPGVTAAGGTSLTASTNATGGRGYSESAWSLDSSGWGGGSGCNTDPGIKMPTYQPAEGCNGRAVADLSADADPATGLSVYDDGQWLVVGGTSLASPLIAAYYAVTGIDGSSPGWAYADSSSLNDPVSGSSGVCPKGLAYICNAGTGYDGPTGVGSISGAIVSGGPGVGGPSAGGRAAGGYVVNADSNSATLVGGVYPNGLDTSYWWQYGTSTGYGQQTAATDAGAGSAPVSTTDTISGLTPGTTYHYRLVAQNSAGTSLRLRLRVHHRRATAPEPRHRVTPGGPIVLYNLRAPSVTGTTREGRTLSASAGQWVGAPTSIRYQWRSCDYTGGGCTNIARATANTLLLTHADVGRSLYVVVTAANDGGSATAISAFTSVVSAAPAAVPHLSALKLSSSSLRANKPLRLTLTLSAKSTVHVAITTRIAGRKVGGRCSATARSGKRCTATVNRGSFTLSGTSGRHTFTLRLPKLAPGRYTASVTARTATRTSNRLSFVFSVVR